MENKTLKIFLCGKYRENTGPANANRSLLTHANHPFSLVRSRHPALKRMERFWRILTSDVTVFSGYRKDMDLEVGFCRLLRKKYFLKTTPTSYPY